LKLGQEGFDIVRCIFPIQPKLDDYLRDLNCQADHADDAGSNPERLCHEDYLVG
jgi:hypothetical protein